MTAPPTPPDARGAISELALRRVERDRERYPDGCFRVWPSEHGPDTPHVCDYRAGHGGRCCCRVCGVHSLAPDDGPAPTPPDARPPAVHPWAAVLQRAADVLRGQSQRTKPVTRKARLRADAERLDDLADLVTNLPAVIVAAHHALTIVNGVTATDRLDLLWRAVQNGDVEGASAVSWMVDHTAELAQIDAALLALTGGVTWPPVAGPTPADARPPAVHPWADEARRALVTIRDGYDHDEDAHKYGTTCRVCLAVQTLGDAGWLATWDKRAVAALAATRHGPTPAAPDEGAP